MAVCDLCGKEFAVNPFGRGAVCESCMSKQIREDAAREKPSGDVSSPSFRPPEGGLFCKDAELDASTGTEAQQDALSLAIKAQAQLKAMEQIKQLFETLNEPNQRRIATWAREQKRPLNRRHFQPPTVADVREYCEERRNNVDPQEFHDFYEANGWVQGKGRKPIVDWRAAVRTWERRDTGNADTVRV